MDPPDPKFTKVVTKRYVPVKIDPVNKVLFGQWNDNKVISFISSLGVFGMSTVQQRVGLQKLDFQTLRH